MELAYSHSRNQQLLRQRNLLVLTTCALGGLCALFFALGASRDREVVLAPVLRSPLTISSAGVSREYLELVTRDVVVLTLDRSPNNLEYWMKSVLDITAPRAQGRLKADLLKIVEEQRGSSIAQFFTIESMELDTRRLQSRVTGELHTIVGNRMISSERRTFQYGWEYSGVSLRLIGFGMVPSEKEARK